MIEVYIVVRAAPNGRCHISARNFCGCEDWSGWHDSFEAGLEAAARLKKVVEEAPPCAKHKEDPMPTADTCTWWSL